MLIYWFDRLRNIAEKGENASNQHFLLFQQCFKKTSIIWSLKFRMLNNSLLGTLYLLSVLKAFSQNKLSVSKNIYTSLKAWTTF